MPRRLALALVFACSASAAVWPALLGKYPLKPAGPSAGTSTVQSEDRALLDELGFVSAEQADYGAFQVTAEKFRDVTGAYAASLAPTGAPGSRVGNFVVFCRGNCPKDFLQLAAAALPPPSRAAIPSLSEHLPAKGLIPESERYIVGPAGLHANAPQIPPAAVAFQFGTEGEFARYKAPGGDQALAIFSFPTPQLARQQTAPLEAIPNAVVKRTGPLVAIVLPPATGKAEEKSEAEALLSQVNYSGTVAWNQPMPLIIRPQTAAQMVLAIFSLAGTVIGFCFLSGLAFALIRIVARKFGYSDAEGTMTTLHLGGK